MFGAQLLPSFELLTESARTEQLPASEVGYLLSGPTPWRFLKNALDPTPRLIIPDFGSGGGYIGIATLALAALGAVARWRRPETWLLLFAGFAFLALSGGYRGAGRDLYELFAQLPMVGAFRTPERLRVVWLFCAVILASDGFAAFADDTRLLLLDTARDQASRQPLCRDDSDEHGDASMGNGDGHGDLAGLTEKLVLRETAQIWHHSLRKFFFQDFQ